MIIKSLKISFESKNASKFEITKSTQDNASLDTIITKLYESHTANSEESFPTQQLCTISSKKIPSNFKQDFAVEKFDFDQTNLKVDFTKNINFLENHFIIKNQDVYHDIQFPNAVDNDDKALCLKELDAIVPMINNSVNNIEEGFMVPYQEYCFIGKVLNDTYSVIQDHEMEIQAISTSDYNFN